MGRLLAALGLAATLLLLPTPAHAAGQSVHVAAASLSGVKMQCRNGSLHIIRPGHTATCRVASFRARCSTIVYTWARVHGVWGVQDCGWHRVGRRQRIVVGVSNA